MKILTFDIEEWFHILDQDATRGEREWERFEYRLEANMEMLFELLERHRQKATFFCLGWICEKHPEIIRRIDAMGYEIATHSHMHQLVYEQHSSEFRADLERSIRVLEDLTGKKVRAYRAPGFSLRQENRWVFEILLEYGIEIDCSIFPARRAHGGFASYGSEEPSLISANSGMIKEFPMSIDRIAGKRFVSSGGGYFRLLPYPVIHHLMRRRDYTMTYFHPHDFDAGRPVIKALPVRQRFKARVGLRGALRKLEQLIEDFDFVDLSEADRMVDWQHVPVISLPERRKRERCIACPKEK